MGLQRTVASLATAAVVLVGCSSDRVQVLGGDETIDVTVEQLQDAPVARRADAAIAWTGEEFLVTGGVIGDEKFGEDGEPETGDDGPTEAAASDTAVGGSMPVHAYDPATGVWRVPSPSPLDARARHVAVWTGEEVLVWGGTERRNGVGDLVDGAAWDPDTDTWRSLPDSPTGTDRSDAEAVVIGAHVVIGGGAGPQGDRDDDLLVLDLAAGTWQVLEGGGRVIDLHRTDDRTALVLRVRTHDGGGHELVVDRITIGAGGPETQQFGGSVPDPARADGAPQAAFLMAAGLVGAGDDVALVLELANAPTEVHPVPVRTTDPPAPALLDELGAGADLDGFGTDPQLAVGTAWLTLARRGGPPTVAWDTTGMARAVAVDEPPACRNGIAWAAGPGALLVTGGDCGGEVVTATARG